MTDIDPCVFATGCHVGTRSERRSAARRGEGGRGCRGAQNCTGGDKRGMRPTRRKQDAPRPTPEEHARANQPG